MKDDEILSGLEKIVESVQIELRYEKGDFAGGYCVLKDKPMIIINKQLSADQKSKILARELAGKDLSHIYIIPVLREIIDQASNETTVGSETTEPAQTSLNEGV